MVCQQLACYRLLPRMYFVTTMQQDTQVECDQRKESFGKLMFSTQIPYRKAQTERAISMNTGCVNMKNNTLAQLYMQLANEFEARVGRNY